MSNTDGKTLYWFNSTNVSVERYFLFSSVALICIFAWMEPAETSGIGLWKGLLFWAVQISILIPLLISVQHLASHHVTPKSPLAPWIQTALSGVVASLLFAPIALYLDVLFGIPESDPSASILVELIEETSGVVFPVTITWLALNAPWIFQLDFSKRNAQVAIQRREREAELPSSEVVLPTRFLQELRSHTAGDLISISSELHYVRVVTTDNEVMFLYNLRDAIEQLPVDAGVQIHRSHWVSRTHIKELRRKNGNSECVLSNGRKLPVSRRKYSEVKDILEPDLSPSDPHRQTA